ncbi:conserved hypothetical protein [Aeropyrum pernix]|uniref:PhoH family protein n=1 Tax=Aeropyrum pernix TaxID=56636 RepID=A0A401HAW2_AERPX|nr:conserved hypothetical protein [Aeropyrum pernix]
MGRVEGLDKFKGLFDALEPKSEGQRELKEALLSDVDLVGVFGPTGTGKSLFSIVYGVSMTAEGRFRRVVLARPVIDVVTGRELTVMTDAQSYRRLAAEYLMDILSGFLGEERVREILSSDSLVLVDPHFLRGRTFDNSVIIVDDSQSMPPEAIVEIITRLGTGSKLIVIGDPVFQRTSEPGLDGASMAREILSNEPTAEVVDLGLKDIVRPGAKRGVKMLMELLMRRRTLNQAEKEVIEAARMYSPDADIITAVDLQDAKKKWGIESDHVPDVLVVVKEGHLGRFIGRGGERIEKIEGETGLRIRAIEHTLDLKEIVRAIHPVSWIHKHVIDFDFAGPQLKIRVSKEHMGPMLGQKGAHIRFLDEIVRKLLGVGVFVEEVEERRGRRRRR